MKLDKHTLDEALRLAERVVALIRPRFYNRLAWIIVLAGLVLMSSPWWSDLAVAIAAKFLQITVPAPRSEMEWGFALVAAGLIYHLITHHLNDLLEERRRARTEAGYREHDLARFAEFVSLMSEMDFAGFLSDLSNQHAYVSADFRKADRARRHLLAPATQFLNGKIRISARDFGLALSEGLEWLSLHFFVHGQPLEDGFRFCLHPDLQEDRAERWPTPEEQRRYSAIAEEMGTCLAKVEEKYLAFRQVVKQELAV